MVEREQISAPKAGSSKKGILIGAAVLVVIVIVLVATMMVPGGPKDDGLVRGDPSDLVLDASDLGSGWSIRNAYINDTGSVHLPGVIASGSIVFNWTNTSGGLLYIVEIKMILHDSIEDARANFENVTTQMMNDMYSSYLDQKSVTVGDGGHIAGINRTMAGHDGKLLVVLEKNMMFSVHYARMNADAPEVTETMAIDIANEQISKL